MKLGLESSRPGPWWLGCLWRWGLRSAMLMSFRSRGNGPSLMMASWSQRETTQNEYSKVHFWNSILIIALTLNAKLDILDI